MMSHTPLANMETKKYIKVNFIIFYCFRKFETMKRQNPVFNSKSTSQSKSMKKQSTFNSQSYPKSKKKNNSHLIFKQIPISQYNKYDEPDAILEMYQEKFIIYENCEKYLENHNSIFKDNQYFPNQTLIPNDCKFQNKRNREMWIHKKTKPGTLLIKDIIYEKGNPYNKEDLYIHSINKEIKLFIGGILQPIEMISKSSIKAFNLKGRSKNIYMECQHENTIIAIEAIWPEEINLKYPQMDENKVTMALKKNKSYYLEEFNTEFLMNHSVFMGIVTIKDNNKLTDENLIEVTILNKNAQAIFSEKITPRGYVKCNKKQTGIQEYELEGHMDEVKAKEKIRELLQDKILIAHQINQIVNICEIPPNYLKGYVDIVKLPYLINQYSFFPKAKIRLACISKKLDIKYLKPNSYQSDSIAGTINIIWTKIKKDCLYNMKIQNQEEENNLRNENRTQEITNQAENGNNSQINENEEILILSDNMEPEYVDETAKTIHNGINLNLKLFKATHYEDEIFPYLYKGKEVWWQAQFNRNTSYMPRIINQNGIKYFMKAAHYSRIRTESESESETESDLLCHFPSFRDQKSSKMGE